MGGVIAGEEEDGNGKLGRSVAEIRSPKAEIRKKAEIRNPKGAGAKGGWGVCRRKRSIERQSAALPQP
jgi:hypothetical protein